MKFCLPADFRYVTIDSVKALEHKYPGHVVDELYGNLAFPESFLPSGRGSIESSQHAGTLRTLEKYVAYLKKNDISFNYTINAGCMDNAEIESSRLKGILAFLRQLTDIGIERCTIASPALIDSVHRNISPLSITASVISDVNSVRRARWIEELGASVIVLQEDLTRNFNAIQSIAANTGAELEIVANSMCIGNCLYRHFHYNCLAHSSEENVNGQLVEYYNSRCSILKNADPAEYIKIPWIRPEDTVRYSQLGITRFKIIGREIVQNMDIPRLLEAYFRHSFDGNLYDLIYGFSVKPNVYIDNRKLDGFLRRFEYKYDCLDRCGTSKCVYCKQYSNNAVQRLNSTVDQDQRILDDFYTYQITAPIGDEELFQGLI